MTDKGRPDGLPFFMAAATCHRIEVLSSEPEPILQPDFSAFISRNPT
jgi:hypothetical protein